MQTGVFLCHHFIRAAASAVESSKKWCFIMFIGALDIECVVVFLLLFPSCCLCVRVWTRPMWEVISTQRKDQRHRLVCHEISYGIIMKIYMRQPLSDLFLCSLKKSPSPTVLAPPSGTMQLFAVLVHGTVTQAEP